MKLQQIGSEHIYFSENHDLQHRNGIAIVNDKKLLNTIINFILSLDCDDAADEENLI